MQSEKRKKQKSDYYQNVFKPRGMQKIYDLARRYGITKDQYDEMYNEQNGKCAICGDEKDVLCVDHDHKTGVIRGLLCPMCNRGLGLFKDSALIVTNADNYINGRHR